MKFPCRYCGGSPKTLVDVPRMTWCAACGNCAEAPSAGAIEPRRTWRDRLFPQPPQPPLQDGATVTQVHVCLDWKDRLRLLLGGQPRVTVVQEFDPKRAGHLVSRSIFWVEAPRW